MFDVEIYCGACEKVEVTWPNITNFLVIPAFYNGQRCKTCSFTNWQLRVIHPESKEVYIRKYFESGEWKVQITEGKETMNEGKRGIEISMREAVTLDDVITWIENNPDFQSQIMGILMRGKN